jgi:hypothetical protein
LLVDKGEDFAGVGGIIMRYNGGKAKTKPKKDGDRWKDETAL